MTIDLARDYADASDLIAATRCAWRITGRTPSVIPPPLGALYLPPDERAWGCGYPLVIHALFVIDPPGGCLALDRANTSFRRTDFHGKAKTTEGMA